MLPANKKSLALSALAIVLPLFLGSVAFGQCPDADSDGLPGSILTPNKLEINEFAAMEGNCGLEVIANGGAGVCAGLDGDTQTTFVSDNSPAAETVYRASFEFNPNAMDFGAAGCGRDAWTRHIIFSATATSVNGNKPIRLFLLRRSGRYFLKATARVTAGTQDERTGNVDLGPHGIEASPHTIELEWQAATTPGVADGFVRFRVDGGPWAQANVRSLTQAIETARIGIITGLNGTTVGSHYFDDFQSFRTLAP